MTRTLLTILLLASSLTLTGCGCMGSCDGGMSSFASNFSTPSTCGSSCGSSGCCGTGGW